MTVVLICTAVALAFAGGLVVVFLMLDCLYGPDELRRTYPWWPGARQPDQPSDVERWGGP